ncbi:MAG: hypothetical protein ACREOC_13730 [Gemmatimonadales bacterium]
MRKVAAVQSGDFELLKTPQGSAARRCLYFALLFEVGRYLIAVLGDARRLQRGSRYDPLSASVLAGRALPRR